MANLIDASFFVAEIDIPNKSKAEVLETVNWFIDKYEPICLQSILGYPLYKAYLAAPTEPRFVALFNGVEYTQNDGVLAKWKGIVQSETESMLAYYIYYFFQKNTAIKQAGIATVIPKAEGSYNISPAEKMVAAYNTFVRTLNEMLIYLTTQTVAEDYPEFTYDTTRSVIASFRPVNTFDI